MQDHGQSFCSHRPVVHATGIVSENSGIRSPSFRDWIVKLWSTFPFLRHQCHPFSCQYIWETWRKVHVGALTFGTFLVYDMPSLHISHNGNPAFKVASCSGELKSQRWRLCSISVRTACCCIQGTAAWSWAWKGPATRGKDLPTKVVILSGGNPQTLIHLQSLVKKLNIQGKASLLLLYLSFFLSESSVVVQIVFYFVLCFVW